MKTQIIALCLMLLLIGTAFSAGAEINKTKLPDEVRAKQIQDMKWGMFICWSFSTFYGHEWTPTLDKDASFFKATGCDTDQWCQTAKDAGMGYILFLAKHHDGFCLWDTKTTEKKVTNSPLGIDVLAKLRKSCDKYGIKLALYFSEGDWNWPGAFDGKRRGGNNPEVKKAQLKELLTGYGPIEFWWMDHAVGTGGLSHKETIEWMHKFQPNTFVGFNHGEPAGRLCLREMGRPGMIGDKNATKYNKDAEGSFTGYHVAEFTYPILPKHKGGAMWFYSLPKHDNLCHPASKVFKDYQGAMKYGNIFSINIGPNYAGKIRDIDVKTLKQVGEMIRVTAGSQQHPLAGADESTPSRSHYFSWINNTNEGSTEAQTLANLDFFKWLHGEYGMKLDIYAFDAGTIDAPRYYGSIYSERFKEHYPNGLDPIYEKAKSFGCRLGVWLGPDGFGDTPDQEKARTDMLVKLCRDYDFHLFKVDAVCGQLRTEKQDAFIRMLRQCRTYCPDLIVLNHRLNLGDGLPYVTTRLWGGEAYIDVWRSNRSAATHNRACTVSFGVPVDRESGKLKRLVEDHGVCLSSALDYWEDDLYLQAFSRNLILAPELYGSPWFLRDDEFPKLARIYNLCRRYRDIAVNGMLLPPDTFGPNALSRGDDKTRIVVLRNTTWEPVTYSIPLDNTIGLDCKGPIHVRRLHVSEEILGSFKKGEHVDVEVLPFRGCVILASAEPSEELGVDGCVYEVVRDVSGKPAIIKLMGMPGTTCKISLPKQPLKFNKARLDAHPADGLLKGKSMGITFDGRKLTRPWHRKLSSLKPITVPTDAEALYEATCFAANNNALEIRSKFRSGPTAVSQVKIARDAFFDQKLLVERGVWDRYLFDGDMDTFFRLRTGAIWGGALRIDMGKLTDIDTIILRKADDGFKPLEAHVSADLRKWHTVSVNTQAESTPKATVLRRSYTVSKEWTEINVNRLSIDLTDTGPIRYVRIPGRAANVAEIIGLRQSKKIDRANWRASNVFAAYHNAPAKRAWGGEFILDEATKNSYLVVACIGPHGRDGAYAALRIDGRYIGSPRRAVSYPANPWEYGNNRARAGLSYFFPVTEDMIRKKIQTVVMQFESEDKRRKVELGQLKPEVWITAYPVPYESKELILQE